MLVIQLWCFVVYCGEGSDKRNLSIVPMLLATLAGHLKLGVMDVICTRDIHKVLTGRGL